MYNNDSYILLNQTLILCSNFTRNYTRIRTRIVLHQSSQSSIRVLRIITYVGFSLSIIALLFLCLCCDGRLFALLYPGCFLVDECYRSQREGNVLKPYCRPEQSFGDCQKKKILHRYSFFSWGFPLVVVGICVTLQLTNTGNVGYGNEDGCQLSLPARTFAVAVPVSSMVLFNIFAVICTAVAIKTARTDQYRGFESEKPTPDCTETDSYHGDHMDPWICVGFLSNSIFGISIHHNQQLSRCADLPLVCVQEECLHSVQTKIHDVNTPTTYKCKRKLAADGV
ncbi:hypothetical protein OS493_003608 [Desmophyllum pertusum]|uniref:Uncharacterized protein n=1 Tax=Desmophyllum pertusum TaxID=174260 RepID=A0A9X0A9B4_9CNID|nr:hypothetical protein OS493_003608 [Desmophyllum pertusum]